MHQPDAPSPVTPPTSPTGAAASPAGVTPPGGRAPRHLWGRYVVTGVCLLILGLGWLVPLFYPSEVDRPPWVTRFLASLVNEDHQHHSELLSPYGWGVTALLLVFGALALARRRSARGGALLLGTLQVLLWTPLVLADLFERSDVDDALVPLLLAPAAGLGLLVVALMAGADDDRPAPLDRRPAVGAGLLLLGYGGAQAAWQVTIAWEIGVGNHLRSVVVEPYRFVDSVTFYWLFTPVALLVLGVLALRRRPAVASAATALLLLELHSWLRFAVSLSVTDEPLPEDGPSPEWTWADHITDPLGALRLATMALGVVTAVAVPPLLRRAARSRGATQITA